MDTMKHLLASLILAVAIYPASAGEEPVSPSAFRKYAEGWTLYFARDGELFGSERFERGGKTRWRYEDGSCVRGVWRPSGAQICFLYEAGAAANKPLCWQVVRDDTGLIARLLEGKNAGLELRVIGRDKRPLLCGDPGTST